MKKLFAILSLATLLLSLPTYADFIYEEGTTSAYGKSVRRARLNASLRVDMNCRGNVVHSKEIIEVVKEGKGYRAYISYSCRLVNRFIRH